MLIKEYRIVMPLTVEEYRIGQLYSTIELSKKETGGGEGIEVIKNEPFENVNLLGGKHTSGQYSYKIYHLETKAPTVLKLITPKGALSLHEESWNAYPYCKTVLTNPGYMKEKFLLIIESLHLEGNASEDNVHSLPEDRLKIREVIMIDIAEPVEACDYRENEDPTLFKSQLTGRGPLFRGKWMNETTPLMTCYKLVTVDCKWFGLQKRIERVIHNSEHRLFTIFHRQIFCWIDKWCNLTLDDIREIEEEAETELKEQIATGTVRGMRASNSEIDDTSSIRSYQLTEQDSSTSTASKRHKR